MLREYQVSTYLGKAVLALERGAALALHETAVIATCALDTDVTAALLEDDGEDDTLVNADGGGGVADGDVDAADIVPSRAGVDHGLLVEAKDLSPGKPLAHGGEVLVRAVVGAASSGLEGEGQDGRDSGQSGEHDRLESHCF